VDYTRSAVQTVRTIIRVPRCTMSVVSRRAVRTARKLAVQQTPFSSIEALWSSGRMGVPTDGASVYGTAALCEQCSR